jgi:hypothetical protein
MHVVAGGMMQRRCMIWLLALGGAAVTLLSGSTWAGGSFVLEGTYLRGQTCTGQDDDVDPLRVKITRHEIVYRGGICSIDDRAEFEKTVTLRVNCRFDSGLVLSSDISFTMRDDKTVDMAQKDGSYNAVLKRCPRVE